MRRYFSRNQGKLIEVDQSESELVLLDKTELNDIERKLKNKTEEAARWAKKLTGEDQKYRLIMVDYIHEGSPPSTRYIKGAGQVTSGASKSIKVYVTVSLPVPAEPNAKNKAKSLAEKVFSQYILGHRRYKLHWAAKSGWSVNLELTEEEYDSFQLPQI